MCDYVQKNFCIDFFAYIFTAIYPFSPSESEEIWILNCSDFPCIQQRMYSIETSLKAKKRIWLNSRIMLPLEYRYVHMGEVRKIEENWLRAFLFLFFSVFYVYMQPFGLYKTCSSVSTYIYVHVNDLAWPDCPHICSFPALSCRVLYI